MPERRDLALLSDPFVFGLCFVALIPVFALVYGLGGEGGFTGDPKTYIDFLYFSTVTISTLGFGDISPTEEWSRLLVSFQVVLGLTCAGMFLNACSYRLSERSAAEEKARQQLQLARAQYEERKSVLLSQHAIVGFRLKKFMLRLWMLTTPRDERGEFLFDSVIGFNGKPAHDFKFKDFRDLHKPTLLLRDSFSSSIVSYFYKDLFLLADSVKNLLNFANLQGWPNLEAECLNFLYAIEHLDYSESIMRYEETAKADEDFMKLIIDELTNASDAPPQMRGSDVMDSYVALYYLAKASVVFGREYMENIDDILSSSHRE